MIILVDYDNIDKRVTRLGIVHVVNKIVSKIDTSEITQDTRHITVRLYGGWYSQTTFTKRAQDLASDIVANFPMVSRLSDGKSSIIVNCDLAYSLLADPANHLFHTFRPRGAPEGLKANHPTQCGCKVSACPLLPAYQFVQEDVCKHCNITKPKDFFYRGEQKLIDTMLTSDLIYTSNQANEICIVSSDDDFWPGIMTSLKNGKRIIHIQTKQGRTTPFIYSRYAGRNYKQKNLN